LRAKCQRRMTFGLCWEWRRDKVIKRRDFVGNEKRLRTRIAEIRVIAITT